MDQGENSKFEIRNSKVGEIGRRYPGDFLTQRRRGAETKKREETVEKSVLFPFSASLRL
jgi:hypothetical protein